jgi:hypothetical protein
VTRGLGVTGRLSKTVKAQSRAMPTRLLWVNLGVQGPDYLWPCSSHSDGLELQALGVSLPFSEILVDSLISSSAQRPIFWAMGLSATNSVLC